jgi:hypothetical protein
MIIVIAFLLSVGILLMYVTGTGSSVAGNVRAQERAFDAAEAGFDALWQATNASLTGGAMADFASLYRTQFNGQPGLDDPASANYFRTRTDDELWTDIVKDPTNATYVNQALPNDSSLSYSVFLINDEAMFGVPTNDMDCLVVCIGRAGRNTYARIEVAIEIQ